MNQLDPNPSTNSGCGRSEVPGQLKFATSLETVPPKSALYDGPSFVNTGRMSQITCTLRALENGVPGAADELIALIYGELRRLAAVKMARERPGITLQPTALVHEAWIRLGDGVFSNRSHFFAAAAEAMRRILIERARRKCREKRGGGAEHVELDELNIAAPEGNEEEALAIDEALDRLAAQDSRKAEVVKLRYFVGFSFEETAEALGISVPTAKRDWAYARAWLHAEIQSHSENSSAE